MNATQHQEYRPFEVDVSSRPGDVRVAPAGEIDMATAGTLQEHIAAQLGGGCRRLVLDLHDVAFMDSTGVRLVLEFARAAQRDNWELAVVRMPPAVRRLFELSGVLDAVPLGDQEVV